MKFYDELKWRGLIKDEAGDDLEKIINEKKACFYWGTDPTADSLHIGHYSSLVTAKRLAKAGFHPILLVGGATGMIGDPRPTSEREIISKETILNNVESIKKQAQILMLLGLKVNTLNESERKNSTLLVIKEKLHVLKQVEESAWYKYIDMNREVLG